MRSPAAPIRRAVACVCLLALAACASPARVPMTLPAADGRASTVSIGDGHSYVVNQQALASAMGGVFLSVTRASAPGLDYSEGLTAKKVAEAWCAGFNRKLNPAALGRFSQPASWLFEGGCT